MMNTLLPTWLAPPPPNIGSAKTGKLKADTWRTFFTVTLVITMIHLWGGTDATPHEERLLDNFLALATAIRWATARYTSAKHIEIVEEQMSHYFTTFLKLFPPDQLTPNHHASLHLVEFLKAYGPVHGWWTFPFERYNGIIQRQNMNNRPGKLHSGCHRTSLGPYNRIRLGELEVTFIRAFCQGANLRALMGSSNGQAVAALREPFKQHCSSSLTRNILHDLLVADVHSHYERSFQWEDGKVAADLPDDVYSALSSYLMKGSPTSASTALPRAAQQRRKIEWKGATYSTSQQNRKNALILFTGSSSRATQAGLIQEIFVHRRLKNKNDWIAEPFCAILPFKCLSQREATQDPYARYPLLDIWLYHNQHEPLIIVSLNDVVSHVASCRIAYAGIGNDLLVIQSLDRVLAFISDLVH